MEKCIKLKRKCTKCDKEKDLKYFSFRKDTNKYRGRCRSCAKGYENLLTDRQELVEELFCKGIKECGKCKELKSIDDFHSDKSTKTGLTSWCKPCKKNYVKENKYNIKVTRVSSVYGVSKDSAKELLSIERCQICSSPMKNDCKHIDHCHDTNIVRGVLCRECNLGLGLFKDNISNLSNAIKYLTRKK